MLQQVFIKRIWGKSYCEYYAPECSKDIIKKIEKIIKLPVRYIQSKRRFLVIYIQRNSNVERKWTNKAMLSHFKILLREHFKTIGFKNKIGVSIKRDERIIERKKKWLSTIKQKEKELKP